MKDEAQKLVNHLKSAGASYADVRMHLLDLTESIATLKGDLEGYNNSIRQGYGIRVLFDGAWGFAAGEDFGMLDVTAKLALKNAQNASKLQQNKIELAPKQIYQSEYRSPVGIDPFTVPMQDKVQRLLELDKQLRNDCFNVWGVNVQMYKRHILFVDTEGSLIDKHLLEVNGSLFAFAPDKDGMQQERSFNLYQIGNGTVGWDNVLSEKQFGQAERVKDELIQILEAPECKEEVCDLIILPEQMALQTHETIGHALELDRILGYELSYAGGSHIDLHNFGSLVFGSPKLTSRADGTVPNSPGSFGFDDDGVKARNVVLIDKGVLVGAITSRQMIMEANRKAGRQVFDASGATNRSESYNRLPIERMNNINVDPGTDGSFNDIISKCENGLMVESPRSWSIGSNRENFHFATQIGWKIKNGKIDHVVRNAQYRGDSLKFWRSLAYVGDESTWQMQQVFNCGKGQPNQSMRLGHGIPLCLFQNVQVGK